MLLKIQNKIKYKIKQKDKNMIFEITRIIKLVQKIFK